MHRLHGGAVRKGGFVLAYAGIPHGRREGASRLERAGKRGSQPGLSVEMITVVLKPGGF